MLKILGFRRKNRKKVVRDVVRAVLIGTAVVLFWRGAWGLLDLYFFPDNQTFSFLASLVVGIGILYFTKTLFKELLGE